MYFVLIMFSIKTVVRNTDWWDTEYLAQAGMKTNPLNAKMFMTMGNVLAQKVCIINKWSVMMYSMRNKYYSVLIVLRVPKYYVY